MADTALAAHAQRRRRRRPPPAVTLLFPLLVALALLGWLRCSYRLSPKLGSLRGLREIRVTWYGRPLAAWGDPERLRQFRASLPRRREEIPGSKCGEDSVLVLHLVTPGRTVSLLLPVDDCPVINSQGAPAFCFSAPETLRLLATWLLEDPAVLAAARRVPQGARNDYLGYSALQAQLGHWRTLDPRPG